MCGFAGRIAWDGLVPGGRDLEDLLGTLTHRGPDQSGHWVSSDAVLTHCRLAVLDVPGGLQPSRLVDSGAVALFAGEIYNHHALRAELRSRGREFHTRSDTEVVAAAFQEWGRDCFRRFDGMFAIAVWEPVRRLLHLARDGVGIKPLYLASSETGIRFGSEPKAVLNGLAEDPTVDAQGLCELFGLWPYKSPGHAIFRDIREVLPGTVLTLSRDAEAEHRFWQLPDEPFRDSATEAQNRVRELVTESVSSQMEADFPIASFLSGGLDSTIVTRLARDASAHVDSFSLAYTSENRMFQPSAFRPSLDDQWAIDASQALTTTHHVVHVAWTDVVAALPHALAARDLPDTGDLDASLYLLAQHVGTTHKVAVSGEGADEVFGGYPWSAPDAEPWSDFPWRTFLTFDTELLRPDVKHQIHLDEYVASTFHDAVARVPRFAGEAPQDRETRVRAHLELRYFLGGQLDRKDRMTMARGLEVRVPLCQRDIIDYIANAPTEVKFPAGSAKGLLRAATSGLIDDRFRLRQKSSYPISHHPDYVETLRCAVVDEVLDTGSRLREVIDPSRVEDALAGRVGRAGPRPTVWMTRLLSTERWLRRYRVHIAP